MSKDHEYLYPYSAQEAKKRNQLSMWRESYHVSVACRNAIEETIRQNFDGMHLKKDCLEPVLAEYGYKRTEWVLATTLQELGDVTGTTFDVAEGVTRRAERLKEFRNFVDAEILKRGTEKRNGRVSPSGGVFDAEDTVDDLIGGHPSGLTTGEEPVGHLLSGHAHGLVSFH